MPNCVAFGCYNTSKKGAMMHMFPQALERRKIWIENEIRLEIRLK